MEKGVEMNARSEETLRNDAWNVPAWDEKVIGRLPGTPLMNGTNVGEQ